MSLEHKVAASANIFFLKGNHLCTNLTETQLKQAGLCLKYEGSWHINKILIEHS